VGESWVSSLSPAPLGFHSGRNAGTLQVVLIGLTNDLIQISIEHCVFCPSAIPHVAIDKGPLPPFNRVLYSHPQIPCGLHLDSMSPPGLQVDSIWKRPQCTILYKIHLDSRWTPGGLQVDSSTCIITKKYQYFSLLHLFLLES